MRQRLRFTYRVFGPMRYASHLERMRAWERAVRRAGLLMVYSAGFHPRPRLHLATALPVGFAAEEELLDLWLEQPLPPPEALQAVSAALPEGLEARRVVEVGLEEPLLPARVQAAEYVVSVETDEPLTEIRRRVAALLAADHLPRQRRGKDYDLRPLVQHLSAEGTEDGIVLQMVLAAREGATGRPEQVLEALELGAEFFRVTRQRLVLDTTTNRDS